MGLLIGILFYCLPSIIAYGRHHRNRSTIGILNVCFGWTGVGWVICLVWALLK
jgi:T4 superinfection immunity protein